MADETPGEDGVSSDSDESRECMPCGGRGQVISNLGGTPQNVTCPWCSGTGVRQANVDAQAAWRERLQAEGAGADGSASEDPAAADSTPGAPDPPGKAPAPPAAGESSAT